MNIWEQYFVTCDAITDRNNEAVEAKVQEVEQYVDQVLTKTYADCGLVYTNLRQDIKAGRFCIWIDNGVISHKTFTLKECSIQALQLEDYPIRPDRY